MFMLNSTVQLIVLRHDVNISSVELFDMWAVGMLYSFSKYLLSTYYVHVGIEKWKSW